MSTTMSALDQLPLLLTILLLALKSTLLLAVAFALARVLRHTSPRLRHGLWTATFCGLLLIPVLPRVVPAMQLAVPILPAPGLQPAGETGVPFDRGNASAIDQMLTNGAEPGTIAVDSATVERTSRPTAGDGGPDLWPRASELVAAGFSSALQKLPVLMLVLWLFGAAASLGALVASLWSARTVARQARLVDDRRWLELVRDIRAELGIRRPVRLLISDAVTTPMTDGWLCPRILLPLSAMHWSAERARIVLLHELVHVRRHDAARHVVTRLAVSFYWLHPLAWLAARRGCAAREHACDEAVIALGARPSVYASHLLEIAEGLGRGPVPAIALPMIERSLLENRLMAILDRRPRSSSTILQAATSLGILLTVLSVASAQPTMVPVPAAPESGAATPITGLAAQDSECWSGHRGGNFRGSMSQWNDDGGRYWEVAGEQDGDRIIQQYVDGVRLCMRLHGDVEMSADNSRIAAIGAGGWVVMEAESEGTDQRLRIGEGMRQTWQVNGAERAVDGQTEQWRDQMLVVLGGMWEAATLRGEQASLRGEIASIRGQRASLRGEIASVHGERASLRGQIASTHGARASLNGRIASVGGERASLRGEIASVRGGLASLQGKIASINGHVSSLRGTISSHNGAISSLGSQRRRSDDDERQRIDESIEEHRAAIGQVEREIEEYDAEARVAEVRREIEQLDVEGKVAAIEHQIETLDVEGQVAVIEAEIEALDVVGQVAAVEREIEALDVEGKVAAIESEIAVLDVEGKVAAIERQIEELDADNRAREIEQRIEPELAELRALIERIGR